MNIQPARTETVSRETLFSALCSKRTNRMIIVTSGVAYVIIWQTHVVSGLVDKRARIDGEIQMRRFQITRLELELAHLDVVIKMFRPNYDLSKIATKRSVSRSKAGTAHGSRTREALTILRESGEALTTRSIAERIIKKRGEPYCADTVTKIGVNIHSSLAVGLMERSYGMLLYIRHVGKF